MTTRSKNGKGWDAMRRECATQGARAMSGGDDNGDDSIGRAQRYVPGAFSASLLFGDEVMLGLVWVEMAEAAIWVGGDDGDVDGCPWLYVRWSDAASLTTLRLLHSPRNGRKFCV
jgi:hypothetical protein